MTQRTSRSVGVGIVALLGIGSNWLCASAAQGAPARGIEWRSDLSLAHAEARTSNRMIWLQFTGPWCQFCHLMDRQTFVHPKVVGQSRDVFVPVKLQSEAHEDLVTRFEVSGLPATVILGPSGDVLAKHEGYVGADEFLSFLASAEGRFRSRSGTTPVVARRAPTLSRPEPSVPRPSPGPAEVGVALAGYCPVSLVQDHRLVPGQDKVTLEHDGRLYRFANAGVRGAFERQPERFVPVNGGRCPVHQVDLGEFRAGNPRFGVLYQGHLYLCRDDTSRVRFLKNPERYSRVDLADRKLCPHCWGREYLLAKTQAPWTWIRPQAPAILSGGASLDSFRNPEASIRR